MAQWHIDIFPLMTDALMQRTKWMFLRQQNTSDTKITNTKGNEHKGTDS
jgi:hypothetical protein